MKEEFRDWIDVIFKIVVAVTGAIVGYYFSFQRQQNEDIRLIVELSTSEREEQRQLGGALAVAFFADERIPEEFFTAVVNSAAIASDKALAQSIVAVAPAPSARGPESSGVQQAIAGARASLPIRIYFHIQQEKDRDAARQLEQTLEAISLEGVEIIVPGIALRSGPPQSQLRCFRKVECDQFGEPLKAIFDQEGWQVALRNLSDQYEGSTSIRPNHFEAWFAPRAETETIDSPP